MKNDNMKKTVSSSTFGLNMVSEQCVRRGTFKDFQPVPSHPILPLIVTAAELTQAHGLASNCSTQWKIPLAPYVTQTTNL